MVSRHSQSTKAFKRRFEAKLRRQTKAELLSAALTSEGGLWGFNQSVWKIDCRRNRVFAITSSDRREGLVFPVINQRFLLLSLLFLISLWCSRNHHTLWPCASLEPQLCRELEDWLSCPPEVVSLKENTEISRVSTHQLHWLQNQPHWFTGRHGKWFKMTSSAVIRILPLCDIQSIYFLLQPILCLIEPSVVKEHNELMRQGCGSQKREKEVSLQSEWIRSASKSPEEKPVSGGKPQRCSNSIKVSQTLRGIGYKTGNWAIML